MVEGGVSRRELGTLRGELRELRGKVERMELESERSRRIGQDVTELGHSLAAFRREHEAIHERDIAARQARARWIITVLIAGLAAIEAPLAYLVAHIH